MEQNKFIDTLTEKQQEVLNKIFKGEKLTAADYKVKKTIYNKCKTVLNVYPDALDVYLEIT
mgnify:CR=1 FL=1